MCLVTKGRKDGCYDSIGGLKNVYLYDFVCYKRYEFLINNGFLIQHPETEIYKYELRADGNTFTEDLQIDETGTSYNSNINLVLKTINKNYCETTNLINKLLGVILETRNNEFYIVGVYNGNIVNSINITTGGSRSDFNGINISLSSKNKNKFLRITDLESSGFNVNEEQPETTLILSSTDVLSSTNVLSSATFI